MHNEIPGFLLVAWMIWFFFMTPGILFLFVWNKFKGESVMRSIWNSVKGWGLTFIILVVISISLNPNWT